MSVVFLFRPNLPQRAKTVSHKQSNCLVRPCLPVQFARLPCPTTIFWKADVLLSQHSAVCIRTTSFSGTL